MVVAKPILETTSKRLALVLAKKWRKKDYSVSMYQAKDGRYRVYRKKKRR